MKKTKLLILFLLVSMFMFMGKVMAKPSIDCGNGKFVLEENNITCGVTIDENTTLIVTSKLVINNVTGDKNTYDGTTGTFKSDGSIVFSNKNAAGTYTINITDGTNSDSTSITLSEAPKTTTTTTTTKAKSSNAYLSSITVNDEKIENFSKNTNKYNVSVENAIASLTVNAVAEDKAAKVSVDGPDKLEVGDNEYTILVTAEDGSKKTYKVIVTRKEKDASTNSKLDDLKVKGYDLSFDDTSKTFHLKIDKNDTELKITATPQDDKATVLISGNSDLEDGSVIKITVTAEDKTTSVYRIIIEKDEDALISSNTNNSLPYVIGGFILLIIIIIVITIVILKKKKNKGNDKNKHSNDVDDKTKVITKISDAYEDDNLEDDDNDEDTKEITLKEVTKAPKEEHYTSRNDYEDVDDNQEYEPKHVDNDEEEKTRMFTYEEQEEIEKTKVLDLDDDKDEDRNDY